MNSPFARTLLLGLAATLAGCASIGGGGGGTAASGVSVTRFHLNQEIGRGEIAIEPVAGADTGNLEFGRYAQAVERELVRLGWRVVRGNTRSEQVAIVNVSQGGREQFRQRPAVSVGLGGGFGGRNVGAGGGVSVPIGGGRGGALVVTELSVRLQRRSDGSAIWEGRAQSEARAGTPAAERGTAVDRLAPALFGGFPGESGQTIRVR